MIFRESRGSKTPFFANSVIVLTNPYASPKDRSVAPASCAIIKSVYGSKVPSATGIPGTTPSLAATITADRLVRPVAATQALRFVPWSPPPDGIFVTLSTPIPSLFELFLSVLDISASVVGWDMYSLVGKSNGRPSSAMVTQACVRRHCDRCEAKELDWLAAVTAIASARHTDGFITFLALSISAIV
jgi:hypothetical protein